MKRYKTKLKEASFKYFDQKSLDKISDSMYEAIVDKNKKAYDVGKELGKALSNLAYDIKDIGSDDSHQILKGIEDGMI